MLRPRVFKAKSRKTETRLAIVLALALALLCLGRVSLLPHDERSAAMHTGAREPADEAQGPVVISYCVYRQAQRPFDSSGHSLFFAEFIGPHVDAARGVEYRPCYAIPTHLPKGVSETSPKGLRLLGLSPDVHIRICGFGFASIQRVFSKLERRFPDQVSCRSGLVDVSTVQSRIKSAGLYWATSREIQATDDIQLETSHDGLVMWPRSAIDMCYNKTTNKPVGPLIPRWTREPWSEQVTMTPVLLDTKRTLLSSSSVSVYWPMIIDSMNWRLVNRHEHSYWAQRAGIAPSGVETIAQLVSRKYAKRMLHHSQRFFMASIHSHCAHSKAMYQSVVIRELFAFQIASKMGKPVHLLGACPFIHRERGGGMQPGYQMNKSRSAVDEFSLHKFALTFENSATSGYVTEKIVNAFLAKAIPVYFGPKSKQIAALQLLNPKAYIHCDLPEEIVHISRLNHRLSLICASNHNNVTHACYEEFLGRLEQDLEPSFSQCIDKIKAVDENDVLYEQMLAQDLVQPETGTSQLPGVWNGRRVGRIFRALLVGLGHL